MPPLRSWPLVVLGMAAGLAHLLRADASAAAASGGDPGQHVQVEELVLVQERVKVLLLLRLRCSVERGDAAP